MAGKTHLELMTAGLALAGGLVQGRTQLVAPIFLLTIITTAETDLTWDAGLYQPAALGNYVWLDENGDGKLSKEEVLNGYEKVFGVPINEEEVDKMVWAIRWGADTVMAETRLLAPLFLWAFPFA